MLELSSESVELARSDIKTAGIVSVAKCRNKFYVRYNLKTEIFNNYCTLNPEVSCFTRLLNGEKSYSKTVREQNKNVDLIRIC